MTKILQEGLYTSTDASLQVVFVYGVDAQGAPNRWKVHGITNLQDWTCVVSNRADRLEIEDGGGPFSAGSVVEANDDSLTLEWPDGVRWKKLLCSPTQLYLLRPVPVVYTPMAISLCMRVFRLLAFVTRTSVSYAKTQLVDRLCATT